MHRHCPTEIKLQECIEEAPEGGGDFRFHNFFDVALTIQNPRNLEQVGSHMISNSTLDHNTRCSHGIMLDETLWVKAFTSVTPAECISIVIIQIVAGIILEENLLPMSMPMALLVNPLQLEASVVQCQGITAQTNASCSVPDEQYKSLFMTHSIALVSEPLGADYDTVVFQHYASTWQDTVHSTTAIRMRRLLSHGDHLSHTYITVQHYPPCGL